MPDASTLYQQLLHNVTLDPSAANLCAMGHFLHQQNRWGAASVFFARALEKEPDNWQARANLGWNLHLFGRTWEAAEYLEDVCEILSITDGTANAWYSQVLGSIGKAEDAITFGRAGVSDDIGQLAENLPPHQRTALNHVALAFALMAAGQWKEGLEEYEHRFAYKIPEFLTRPYRLWRGERVHTLYIECEQGAGDSIMGLRWLSLAAERAEKVTLFVHQSLYALLGEMDIPGNVRALPLPQPLPAAEAWSPLWSLPVALELDEPFCWDGPYVGGNTAADYPMLHLGPGPVRQIHRIGIAFAGNPTHEQAHHRDCPLVYWMPLLETPNTEWHSLQIGFDPVDPNNPLNSLAVHGLIRDRSSEITNFLDTARIIGELDLVIAVDTAVAHLAGAMGVPTWLLLNQRGLDFRWGRNEAATSWYPSMTLYRRGLDEEAWIGLMGRVKADLEERVR